MNADTLEAPAAAKATGLRCAVERAPLLRAIASVAPFAKVGGIMPVLGAIRLQAVSLNRLEATATNLDNWVRASVAGEVDHTGELVVAAPLLRDCIDRMPGDQVVILEASGRTTVKSGTARATLNGFAAEEFPPMPTLDYGEARLPWPALSAALKRVLWAASSEESRPILNGLSWRSEKGVTKLCATNGHKLALATLPFATPIEDAILPASTLAAALKLFAGEQEIEVGRGNAQDGHVNYLGLRSDDAEIQMRLIDGPYPQYQQVIPRGGEPRTVRVAVAPLVAAIRRVGICASTEFRQVAFTFAGNSCKVSASTADLGNANDLVTTEGWEGDEFAIGFNRDIILAALSHTASESVDFAFRSDRGAGILTPVTAAVGYEWLGLVMPLRLPG